MSASMRWRSCRPGETSAEPLHGDRENPLTIAPAFPFMLCERLDFDLSLGLGSGVTSPARRGKSGAAGVRICGRCRATQPERQCQRREYSNRYPLHGESFHRGLGNPPYYRVQALTPTFSCDIAYSASPAASRALPSSWSR